MTDAAEHARPAFYALRPGGWRDYVTLLHPPWTLWHLSYVAIGAGLAPDFRADRLGWTLLAFFLAMGIGAHALDEIRGRPLQTQIGVRTLAVLAVASIGGAVAIGIWGALTRVPWLLVFVALGAFIVVAYNLESFGGLFHGTWWFALAWGSFPVLTAAFASAERLTLPATLGALFAGLLSLAQQQLSRQVRMARRRVRRVTGTLELVDGASRPVTRETLMLAPETALRTLAAATVVLAATIVAFRLA